MTMYTLRDIEIGDYVKNRDGGSWKVLAIYNRGSAAHQLLLEGEIYPMLLSEMLKCGYSFGHKGSGNSQ